MIRVFPRRTSYTPEDEYAFFGLPPFPWMLPPHDEVHISCTFTWDMDEAEELKFQWEAATDKPVRIGGPAYDSFATDFIQGLYLKPNIIFTTRGCNNACPWCHVPKLEGKLHALEDIPIGNVIQDNNFLQADRAHKDRVFEMLKTQKMIRFSGGLEPDLIDDHFVEAVRGLRIKELWLACDTAERLPLFKKGVEKLVKAGFTRDYVRCYCLSYCQDMAADEERMREVYRAGAMPFVQLYQDRSRTKNTYTKEWREFQRNWTRPAIARARMNALHEEDA